jgi:hypothetical protein
MESVRHAAPWELINQSINKMKAQGPLIVNNEETIPSIKESVCDGVAGCVEEYNINNKVQHVASDGRFSSLEVEDCTSDLFCGASVVLRISISPSIRA